MYAYGSSNNGKMEPREQAATAGSTYVAATTSGLNPVEALEAALDKAKYGKKDGFVLLSRSIPADTPNPEIEAMITLILATTDAALKHTSTGRDAAQGFTLHLVPASKKEATHQKVMFKLATGLAEVFEAIFPKLSALKHGALELKFTRYRPEPAAPPKAATHTALLRGYDLHGQLPPLQDAINFQQLPNFHVVSAERVTAQPRQVRNQKIRPSGTTTVTLTIQGKPPATRDAGRTDVEIGKHRFKIDYPYSWLRDTQTSKNNNNNNNNNNTSGNQNNNNNNTNTESSPAPTPASAHKPTVTVAQPTKPAASSLEPDTNSANETESEQWTTVTHRKRASSKKHNDQKHQEPNTQTATQPGTPPEQAPPGTPQGNMQPPTVSSPTTSSRNNNHDNANMAMDGKAAHTTEHQQPTTDPTPQVQTEENPPATPASTNKRAHSPTTTPDPHHKQVCMRDTPTPSPEKDVETAGSEDRLALLKADPGKILKTYPEILSQSQT